MALHVQAGTRCDMSPEHQLMQVCSARHAQNDVMTSQQRPAVLDLVGNTPLVELTPRVRHQSPIFGIFPQSGTMKSMG